jgi:hypothetical protein
LARVLDEATVANLNSIVHANNAVVRFKNSLFYYTLQGPYKFNSDPVVSL